MFIANLGRRRRPEFFFDLAEHLLDFGAKFIVCGREAEDSHYQRKLVDRMSRLPNLIYLGEVSQDKVNEILCSASLMVFPSPVGAFSNAFIQSWLRETPVVTVGTDIGKITGNEEISIFCNDFNELVFKVKNLLINKDMLSELGKKVREFAESNYSSDKIKQKHIAYFNGI